MHLSPLVLLAVVSDVAYGSQAYLEELADELKRPGVIDQESTIHDADDLLGAVAGTVETMATAFDAPPLSLEGLKQTIDETRGAARAIDPTKVISQAEVKRLWEEIHETAAACRFANCKHLQEPGCAVKNAVESGAILERRYDSYRRVVVLTEQLTARRY